MQFLEIRSQSFEWIVIIIHCCLLFWLTYVRFLETVNNGFLWCGIPWRYQVFHCLENTNLWKRFVTLQCFDAKTNEFPQRVLFREEDIPFFSREVANLYLFFTHAERVFFGTPYFAATSLFIISFSKLFTALHFTRIGLLFKLRFVGTIFLSQITKNGLFEFTTLGLCFQKSNAWFENVGEFEF